MILNKRAGIADTPEAPYIWRILNQQEASDGVIVRRPLGRKRPGARHTGTN